ncbi:Uncharacterised protein [Chlamydia abortus]|nr:hypothetical protein CP01DC11_0763 [Chlamydia psittaci 01DC11]EPJ19677.1 hypothetical protein CP02DC23_0756 [Chlamydia psittaci 02DC23]EPJ20783.1 hypothetical protein CP02DC21_0403 [Chlamydia psittaci 02DC21]EPJ24947.1 hypothetical protein CP03DC29_0047 [Chlamydia psittaci 03DC29]EPJ32328.1 hypothetical protein CP061683_0066 [Chlamydia psittaci 06-1683]EPJ99833.1 hypothetical protein CP02DC14_0420 [Chlamydia psittaci 02DC14]EPP32637.1 hypothetical protein CPC197_0034 [Chlamydia psittaci C1
MSTAIEAVKDAPPFSPLTLKFTKIPCLVLEIFLNLTKLLSIRFFIL